MLTISLGFSWVLIEASLAYVGGVTNTILELPKRFDWGVFKFGCRGDPLPVALVGCKTRPYQPILRFWRRFNARPDRFKLLLALDDNPAPRTVLEAAGRLD